MTSKKNKRRALPRLARVPGGRRRRRLPLLLPRVRAAPAAAGAGSYPSSSALPFLAPPAAVGVGHRALLGRRPAAVDFFYPLHEGLRGAATSGGSAARETAARLWPGATARRRRGRPAGRRMEQASMRGRERGCARGPGRDLTRTGVICGHVRPTTALGGGGSSLPRGRGYRCSWYNLLFAFVLLAS